MIEPEDTQDRSSNRPTESGIDDEPLAVGRGDGDERVPLAPEAAISQPEIDERDRHAPHRSELRDAYGYVRAYFKARPDRFRGHQRRLRQARSRETYDIYLATSVRWASIAGLVGGGLVGMILLLSRLVAAGHGPRVTETMLFQSFSAATPSLGMILTLSALGVLLPGIGVLLIRSYRLRSVISQRRRSIDMNLPYAIMFMYALSKGGMNFLDVCRRLAATEIYGEVANEFDTVVREIDLFGNGLIRALNNVQTLTPSDNFRRFLDDLLSVLESGGDLEKFLHNEAEEYLDDAQDEQATFIETIGTLSELFVVVFVAAPLFLIVVLIVVSFLGAETVWMIALLIYLAFPLGMVGFLLVIDQLSPQTSVPAVSVDIDSDRTALSDAVRKDDRFKAYRRAKRGYGLQTLLSGQARAIRSRPVRSLWLTAPAALLVATIVGTTGVVDPTGKGFSTAPVRTTTGIVVGPLLVASVPLMILHERGRRRARAIVQRLPDLLDLLSNANEMGIGLVEGCGLVSKWGSGAIADEFRKVRNDLAWNHDIKRALLAFADRMEIPQLTRTMTLVAEGSRASGDLHSLLQIAANDTRARAKLERARRRTVDSYVTIVVIGFLVYLLVIVLVSASYLAPIEELTAGAGAIDRPEALAGVGAAPVDTYRMLFFHSALIQGFGSGVIAGKLADGDMLSGLKYAVSLVLLTVVAFVLFV